MKWIVCNALLLIFFASQAQDRKPFNGVVLAYDAPLENVHIRNVTTGKFASTNIKGEFTMNIRLRDTLVISHISMLDVVKFISEGDIIQDPLIINMVSFSNELKEVTINQYSEINAVSEGIIPKKIEKLSTNERRLQTAGDFKFVHLLSILGGGLQIDPILNAINGRTRKLKKNILIERKEQNISILENGYHNYMQESMGLTNVEINALIRFCVEEENLQNILASKNEGRIHLFLIESWNKYKSLQK